MFGGGIGSTNVIDGVISGTITRGGIASVTVSPVDASGATITVSNETWASQQQCPFSVQCGVCWEVDSDLVGS
jgi:hypothetical protein